MKKLFTIALGLTLAAIGTANATIIRVNNLPGSGAIYTTVQLAHNAASAGDTLYIESSPTGYGTLTATKPLVYIGPGYFLNGNQQVNTNAAQLSTVYLESGASGTQMMGLHLTTTYIGASNVIFKRNYSPNFYLGYNAAVSDIFILQNYEVNINHYNSVSSDILINNNYINSISLNTSSVTGVLLFNNVISNHIHIRNAAVYNNIHRSGGLTAENSSFNYNIGHSTEFNPASIGTNSFGNNLDNVDLTANVFVPVATNPNDRQFQLRTDVTNPAIGAGINGEDIGMYGGNQSYVISGIPAIPAVYFLNTSGVGNNTVPLNVTTKVRSHN